MIGIYLLAIVSANLITAWFGPVASVFNSFFLIGLDLTARDSLHDAWQGRGLVWKMGALIASGSVLSWLLNRGAGSIALASCAAFCAAAVVDSLVYQVLRGRVRFLRINGSNVLSAAVDSVVFPVLAFGLPVMWPIVLGHLLAKICGGFAWSLVICSKAAAARRRRVL